MKKLSFVLVATFLTLSAIAQKTRMVEIPAGSFLMGSDGKTTADYDEFPQHAVTLSASFRIASGLVSAKDYKTFRMDYQDVDGSGIAKGMSWFDAMAYCEWLSKREGKHYRLPTEAEWEYVAGLGVVPGFVAGPEWTQDFYGRYGAGAVKDPGGVARSFSRAVRGGAISSLMDTHVDPERGTQAYFARVTNRSSVTPEYAGRTPIGFRLVESETVLASTPEQKPFAERFVLPVVTNTTAVSTPHLRIRPLLPIPPENMLPGGTRAAGMDPAVMGHLHSAGAAACGNGDVVWIGFSSLTPDSEYSPATTFVITRLRRGSDEWDVPELFYDFADVNEQSALLWDDGGTMRFFGGGAGLSGVPFRMQESVDCGGTWSAVRLPLLKGHVGGFATQPITSAFRKEGAMYLATDATPDASMLWKSIDEGETWSAAGERTRGRHTAFVVLRDGSILGMGGKNTNIDGYMPQFLSGDNGKTWVESKTGFPALNVNQRPTLIRLKSGRLFFAADMQNRQGKQPAGFQEHGVMVALSSDEGKTWVTKTLPGVLPHEASNFRERKDWSPYFDEYGTVGYTIATQTPDGLIHLIGSMTHPSQEFELNEAWIFEGAGVASDAGGFLLEGSQEWKFPDGSPEYRVTYRGGKKTGDETLWSAPGVVAWRWRHLAGDVGEWTQFNADGRVRSVSHWRGKVAEGEALFHDETGKEQRVSFRHGELTGGRGDTPK